MSSPLSDRTTSIIVGMMVVLLIAAISIVVYLVIITDDVSFHIVHGTSMHPTLEPGDLLIVSGGGENTFDELQPGDIIVYTTYDPEFYGWQVVHRVIATPYHHNHNDDNNNNSNQQKVVITKGDNNEIPEPLLDYPILTEDYKGKVISSIPYIGLPSVLYHNMNTTDTQPTQEQIEEGMRRMQQ